MNAKPLPPLEYLKECFDLDPTCPSGLRWRNRPCSHFNSEHRYKIWTTRYARKPAGSIWIVPRSGKAYYRLALCDVRFLVHRIILSLLLEKTLSSADEVDHADNNGLNNSKSNLRLATTFQNSCNVNLKSNNTSGVKGVSWSKKRKLWHAYVKANKVRHQAFFKSKDDANKFATDLRNSLHINFANHG